jgi:hypothetical protein
MATDSVMGLFMDPNQLMQQQSAATDTRAAQFARMSPMEQAQYGIYGGANRVAGGLAGLMGAEDPQMKLAAARQQILQQVDQTDPQSMSRAAQALNQAGDVQGARMLAQAAQEMAVKQSQITRNLREKPASTTELEKLQDLRAELVSQFGENDPRVKEVSAAIAKKTTGGGIGSEIAAGLAPLVGAMASAQAKKAAEAGGTEVGKKIADIEGSQSALTAIKGAKDIFNKGIYAGKYGPTMEGLAGYTGGTVGSTERLANTETFRSYLGDVVIPGLKDFGGSDTVEELKYLQGVYAGDTTAQPKALKNMLERAETKITSKINRIQSQQKAIETGTSLPTGPNPSATPKATRRFNMQTGKFETITQ